MTFFESLRHNRRAAIGAMLFLGVLLAVLPFTVGNMLGNSWLRILDFAPRFRSRGRVFRPMMFVRSVEPLAGRPTLRLRLRPTAGFGERCEPGISGSHHIRFAADGLNYRVTTDASLASLLGTDAREWL